MSWRATHVAHLVWGLMWATPVLAHNPLTSDGQEQLAGVLTAAFLLLFWGLYGFGARRLQAPRWRQWLFHSTAVLAALTLLGSLDDWAKTSTAAHMAQHMLLMVVIAPLWVISGPLPALSAAAGGLARALWQPLLTLTRHPILCAWIHGAAIWFWHMPLFYMLAVVNPWWHAIEHGFFIGTAGLFWWSVLRSTHRNAPWAMLALLLTLMHTGFLGAILTFANAPLYGEARNLQDQQLAGLIMWVLGAIPYLMASAWAAHRWYGQLLRRMQ